MNKEPFGLIGPLSPEDQILLKKYGKMLGWAELAKRMKLCRATVWRIANGHATVHLDRVLAVMDRIEGK